jgi:predicted flap endonuclease-1-like 5' DNA nuclease
MNSWQDYFQAWRDAQQGVWENLESLTTNWTRPIASRRWPPADFKHLTEWGRTAVRQALSVQSQWIEQWSERIKREGQTPEALDALMKQAIDMVQGGIRSQQELWDHWFEMLEENTAVSGTSQQFSKQLAELESRLNKALTEEWKSISRWGEGTWPQAGSPATLEEFSEQFKTTMHEWTEAQNRLWNHWLGLFADAEAKEQTPAATEGGDGDDLTRISGIGPGLAAKLKQQGITTFAQLAALSDAEIDQLEETIIKFPGRIRREDWVGQAKQLLRAQP